MYTLSLHDALPICGNGDSNKLSNYRPIKPDFYTIFKKVKIWPKHSRGRTTVAYEKIRNTNNGWSNDYCECCHYLFTRIIFICRADSKLPILIIIICYYWLWTYWFLR